MKQMKELFQALLGAAALIPVALIAVGRYVWYALRKAWSHRPIWFRQTMKGFAITIPSLLLLIVAINLYKELYGRKGCWYDEHLSDNVTLHFYGNDKCRVYNECTGKHTTGRLSWVSEPSANDSLAVYALPHKRGFLNVRTGEIVIDAKKNNYSRAWVFSEGLAAVERGGKIGFINAKNEVVIPFEFDYPKRHKMDNLAYLFHNGYCVMANAEGKMGLIDKSGRWVIDPQYDELWAPQVQGYRVVVDGGKQGLLDASLNLVYDTSYDYIGNYSADTGFVLMKGGRMWQEDKDGNVVQPFMCESTTVLRYPAGLDEDGYSYLYARSDYLKYQIAGKYGIMDAYTGRPLTLAIYEDVRMVSSMLFEVRPANSYGVLIIDAYGDIIKE